MLPAPDAPLITFVHDDVDTGWDEIGPSMLTDAVAYHQWSEAAGTADGTASLSAARSVTALRAEGGSHRMVTPDEVPGLIGTYGTVGLHPLCGGLDPEIAWPYLRRAVAAVEASGG